MAAVHARLVEEHGAILFPPQSFRQKRVFTYHLEQLLIRPDARPTLFDARLDDLTGTGDALVLHLSARLGSNVIDARRLRLRLRCTHDQARTLIDDPPGASPLDLMPLELLKNDYAVVAKVDGVNRIVNYTYTAQAAEGDAELEVTSPDVFAVTGELVAIHALPAPSMNATVKVSGDVETNEPDVAKWDE